MNNDLNEIRIFVEVAKLQNFTKAAQRLKVEKSTVSNKVKQLEKRLDIRLLQRTTRKVQLTPAGEHYLSFCKEALDSLSHADQYIADLNKTPSGYLKVAVPHNFIEAVSNSLINPFLEKYPKVTLEIVQTDNTIDLIEEGYDLAVRYEYGNVPDSSLVYRKLFEAQWCAVAAKDYVARFGYPTTLAEIDAFPSVGTVDAHKASDDQHKQTLYWGKTKVPLKHRFITNNTRATIAAIKAGVGFGLLPKSMIQKEIESGELVPFTEQLNMPNTTLYVVYPSRVGQPAKSKALLEALLEWAKPRA